MPPPRGQPGNYHLPVFIVLFLLQIASFGREVCVDSACKPEDIHKPVGVWPCHSQGGNQVKSRGPHGPIWLRFVVGALNITLLLLVLLPDAGRPVYDAGRRAGLDRLGLVKGSKLSSLKITGVCSNQQIFYFI